MSTIYTHNVLANMAVEAKTGAKRSYGHGTVTKDGWSLHVGNSVSLVIEYRPPAAEALPWLIWNVAL